MNYEGVLSGFVQRSVFVRILVVHTKLRKSFLRSKFLFL